MNEELQTLQNLVEAKAIEIVFTLLLMALVYIKMKISTVKLKGEVNIKDVIETVILEVEVSGKKGIYAKNLALELIEKMIGKKLYNKYKRNIEIWIDDKISWSKIVNTFIKK